MSTSTDLRLAVDEVRRDLLEPTGDLADLGAAADTRGALDALARRFGALPWWVISSIIHGAVLLLVGLAWTVITPPRGGREIVLVPPPVHVDDPPPAPPNRNDVFPSHLPDPVPSVEDPLVTREPDTLDWTHDESPDDMDAHTLRGDPLNMSDVPMGGASIGVIGMGDGPRGGGPIGFRTPGGRRKMIRDRGGSLGGERAVEAALRWLAAHQEPDGRWDGTQNGDAKRGHAADVGLTGLATLAFLGAGYTHTGSDRHNRHKKTVRRALDWLVSCQEKDEKAKLYGRVYLPRAEFSGRNWWFDQGGGYGHAIAGLALAEAYGMTKDETLRRAAQSAVDYSVNVHQRRYSGWRYRPNSKADLSVTGWYVMQLKSARVAGLRVDGAAEQGAKNFLAEVTGDDGTARYMPGRPVTPCMTSVGLVCRLFMGAAPDDPVPAGAAASLKKNLPEWDAAAGWNGGFYYWYYGTLGMFQMGGDAWRAWNGAMRDMLVENQRTADDGADLAGSWDPVGGCPSRVFSTAAGALCLEVYYRYLPMYN